MRKVLLIILIFSLTLTLFHTYLQSGFPYTNDGENHLARFANYKLALKEGQFPPRFAPNLMNHYGYPVFNFNYPLANILSLPFSLVKVNSELAFKVISLVSFTGGLFGIYKLLQSEKKSLLTIVIGMSLFGLQPYLVNIVLFRGSIGELLAASLLPWVLWSINQIIEKQKTTLFTVFIGSIFLLSHNLTILISAPFILAYAILKVNSAKNRKLFIPLSINFFASVALTLWFWLPAILEANQTVVRDASIANQFFHHFSSINELITGQLGFGFSSPGPVDSLSFQMGLVGVLVIFSSVIISLKSLIQRQKISGRLLFLLSEVLIVLFLQLPGSAFLWKLLPPLQIIQFPWRLSIMLGTLIPLLWAESAEFLSRNFKKILIAACFINVYLVAQLKPVDFFHRNQIDYDVFSQSTSTQNENRTKEFTYVNIGDWQPKPSIEGTGSVAVSNWAGSYRNYNLNLETPSTIIEPTMNFLGWQTTVVDSNGDTKRVKYLHNDDVQGRIAFELPAGQYTVHSAFTQLTPSRVIGNTVSLLAFVGVGIYWIKKKKSQMYVQTNK